MRSDEVEEDAKGGEEEEDEGGKQECAKGANGNKQRVRAMLAAMHRLYTHPARHQSSRINIRKGTTNRARREGRWY